MSAGRGLERLRTLLVTQGGLMATLLRPGVVAGEGCESGAASPALAASRGPRAEGRREEYELFVEAIYEGYLLHYGSPRLLHASEADLALLAGDQLYAIGLARLVALGDAVAVAELADTITLSALAHSSGDAELADAIWAAGARAVGWGPSEAHGRAKELVFAGAPGAFEAMRTSASRRRCFALNPASILFAAVQDKRAKHKSKYTLDRQIPGAFEGETVTRRRFMTGSANAAGVIAAGAFTLPALGFAIGPIFKSTPVRWLVAGPVGLFTDTNYVPVVVTLTPGIGEAGNTTIYIRKHNPAIDTDPYDEDTPYIAITSRCAHLGCPVRWVDAAERFICPCHGGVYDLLGRRVGGPPPRPLDRFYTRVNGENVEVGPRFSVNSELRRFSPRDPGEPLDGIGQYLYPSRPGAQKL